MNQLVMVLPQPCTMAFGHMPHLIFLQTSPSTMVAVSCGGYGG